MNDAELDRAFVALGDPVRRAIIARLSRGPATVGELAEPFPITMQAVSRHIRVLEDAGLVTRSRDAQRRPVHLDAAALEQLTAWIDRYRLDAERAYRRLDAVLAVAASRSAAASPTAAEPAAHPQPAAPARPPRKTDTKEKES
jgi:DNA-binding transcriptional ArsR family regulator